MGKETLLLLCAIMQLIGVVYLHECPAYQKHEALRKDLLTYKAICRAVHFGFEDKICLDGLKPDGGYNCEIGSSDNVHCATGGNDVDKDYNLKCASVVYDERQKLCEYYANQLKYKNQLLGIFPRFLTWFNPTTAAAQGALQLLFNNEAIEDYVNSSCPAMGWKVSEI